MIGILRCTTRKRPLSCSTGNRRDCRRWGFPDGSRNLPWRPGGGRTTGARVLLPAHTRTDRRPQVSTEPRPFVVETEETTRNVLELGVEIVAWTLHSMGERAGCRLAQVSGSSSIGVYEPGDARLVVPENHMYESGRYEGNSNLPCGMRRYRPTLWAGPSVTQRNRSGIQ